MKTNFSPQATVMNAPVDITSLAANALGSFNGQNLDATAGPPAAAQDVLGAQVG